MEFKTETFIPAVIGIMLTLILVVSIMIPVFDGLDDDMGTNRENAGAIYYAELYESGEPTISITIDPEHDKATVGGDTIDLVTPGGSSVIAASTDLQIVYTQAAHSTTHTGYMTMMANRIDSTTERMYYDVESVTLSTSGQSISIVLDIEPRETDPMQLSLNNEAPIYYISATGPYGVFDHNALMEGINVDTDKDWLGVIAISDGNADVVGTWSWSNGAFRTEMCMTSERAQGSVVPSYTVTDYAMTVVGDRADHGSYATITVDHMYHLSPQIYVQEDYWMIAPINYHADGGQFDAIMLTVLWLLPVLVVLGCMVIAAQYMTSLGGGGSGERPTIRRDRPKER